MLTAAENASFSEAVLTFGGHRGLEEHRASLTKANFQDTRNNCKSCFYDAESQFEDKITPTARAAHNLTFCKARDWSQSHGAKESFLRAIQMMILLLLSRICSGGESKKALAF